MKILLYNWAPLKLTNKGGGVSVYLRNLIDEITSNSNDSVFYLSSGALCDEINREIRYEEMPNNGRYREFSIINSPVFSPAYLMFCRINILLEDEMVKGILDDFLNEFGPFDIVHFNNIEGLSIKAFSLRKKYPTTKFIFSIHNYNIFCPQVNLWKKEMLNCDETNTGKNCIECMVTHVPIEKLVKKMSITYELYKASIFELDEKYVQITKEIDKTYKEIEERPLSKGEMQRIIFSLERYRTEVVKTLNENVDMFIAVSNRVKLISILRGIDKGKIKTLYIGTKFATNGVYSCNTVLDGRAKISMIYMGYQRYDKGFFFLIDALNELDASVAKYIDLTLAAKGDNYDKKTWSIDEKKFNSFRFINGYTHEMLDDLLKDKNLGVVPVLWEDNMPQVAMEMASHGVPILSSDLGGVSELCARDERFVFKAGDRDMLISKIVNFVNHPEQLNDYYEHFIGLKTMSDHIKDLYDVYQSSINQGD